MRLLRDGLRCLSLIFVFILGMSSKGLAFSINSTTFDQRVDTGGYREFILENRGNEAIRYKFNVRKGDKLPDISKWVKLYPKVMNIPPLEKRVLKVYAQSPKDAKIGEYGFKLTITPLIVPKIVSESGKITGSSAVGITPILNMYGYVGNPKFEENIDLKDLNFKRLKDGRVELEGKIVNKSYAGFNVGLKFVGSNDTIMDGAAIARVPKEETQEFKVKLDKRIAKPENIKKIIIYDALNLKNLKTVVL